MTDRGRNHIDDLRGVSRLAVEATRGVTDLVEAMHHRIAWPIRALSRPVFAGIRGVTSLVGTAIDAALSPLSPLIAHSAPGPQREALVAALNGVLGDYLDAMHNPLAIQMRLRRDEEPQPGAGNKVLIFIHGSSMSDQAWRRATAGALAGQLGYTPLYLHYNSGLHISANGRSLAALLEGLLEQWPVPLDDISIVGHSMGGLVARSACHAAVGSGHRWRARLRNLIFLGTPHHGAALERYGNLVDVALGISSYSAPFARLGKIRSAGVTDLRYGNVLDQDWQGRDRFQFGRDPRRPVPLPEGVRCFAIAASTSKTPDAPLRGDGLISVNSALGRHRKPERRLAFPAERQWIAMGMGHLDLLGRAEVYEVMARWLRDG